MSGKPYEHLTFIKLQSSATSGCLLCKFLIQKVTLGLRRPLDTANPLNIFLEQHSSDKQAMRRNFRHTEQILRLNADDDNFRDVNIGTHSGYNSTLIAVVARPESAPAIGATVEEQEVSYVTLEFSTDSGWRLPYSTFEPLANIEQEREKESLTSLSLDVSCRTLAIPDATI